VLGGLSAGAAVELVREPANVHDPSAIAVRIGLVQLGYLRREIARRLAPQMDGGVRYVASITDVTGGGVRHAGANLFVRKLAPLVASGDIAAGVENGERVEPPIDAAELGASIRRALIGERPVREGQHAVLERLAAGRSTLAVFGTGRGKSFCFQYPAADAALRAGRKTVVFYPLRALANDQFEAMRRRLAPLGVRVLRANGSIEAVERAELDAALASGDWDVVLATPEFATFHRAAFLRPCNAPDLVVIDEAHHLHESRHRAAYATLGELVTALRPSRVLALTATASDETFGTIRRELGIDAWAIDPTVRANLTLVDARNATDKLGYLARELVGDGKAIVYCNSRGEATKLADRLRARLGPHVGYYHAGVDAAARLALEGYFRSGDVRVVVATSAFGEGIDLPDVRDVVLYHLNFDYTGFNQMAGRAGRDEGPARIHLLYGEGDRRINDYIIGKTAPSLPTLREIYRGLRGLATNDRIGTSAEEIARTLDLDGVEAATIGVAVRIFEEAGLARLEVDDEGRAVRLLPAAARVDLTATARYQEAEAERDAFERFCGLALGADVATLEQIVNRPIYPDRVALRG